MTDTSPLLSLDYALLRFINKKAAHPVLDAVSFFMNKFRWYHIPLILIIGFPVFYYTTTPYAWYSIAGAIAVLLTCTDLTTFALRTIIKRPRPSDTLTDLRLLKGGGGHSPYSFPSSHASNAVGIAVFCFFICRWASVPFIILAITICLSRIYIGKHYPSDVVAGSLLGAGWAFGIYRIIVLLNIVY